MLGREEILIQQSCFTSAPPCDLSEPADGSQKEGRQPELCPALFPADVVGFTTDLLISITATQFSCAAAAWPHWPWIAKRTTCGVTFSAVRNTGLSTRIKEFLQHKSICLCFSSLYKTYNYFYPARHRPFIVISAYFQKP